MQIGVEVIGRNRRRVDQLHRDVFPGHHRRRRHGRGEGIGGHFGRGPREDGDQLALAGVRSAEQDDRAGPLPGDAQAASLFARALLNRHLLLELSNLRLQFRLKVIGPLVLGDLLHHHLEALQFLFEALRPAILLFGLEILLGKIGGHCANGCGNSRVLVPTLSVGTRFSRRSASDQAKLWRRRPAGIIQPRPPRHKTPSYSWTAAQSSRKGRNRLDARLVRGRSADGTWNVPATLSPVASRRRLATGARQRAAPPGRCALRNRSGDGPPCGCSDRAARRGHRTRLRSGLRDWLQRFRRRLVCLLLERPRRQSVLGWIVSRRRSRLFARVRRRQARPPAPHDEQPGAGVS